MAKKYHAATSLLSVQGTAIKKDENPIKIIKQYVYPQKGCNIQVGTENTMIINEAGRLLVNESARGEADLNRDEVMVGLLNTILNPKLLSNPSPMPQRTAEETFKKVYGKHFSGKQFSEVAGLPLDLFVDKYPQSFKRYTKKGEIMLRSLTRKPTNKIKSHTKQTASRPESACSSVDTNTSFHTAQDFGSDISLSENEFCELSTTPIGNGKSVNDSENNILIASSGEGNGSDGDSLTPRNEDTVDNNDITECDSWDWKTVTRKKHKRKTSISLQNNSEIKMGHLWKNPHGFTAQKSNDLENRTVLQQLLSRPEGKSLRFVSENAYTRPLKCMIDIVSMWNTPSEKTSYIVIGASMQANGKLQLQGLTSMCQFQHSKDLFDKDIFTTRPEFSYFETTLNGRLFGVLKLSNRNRHSVPCIVKCSYSDDVQEITKSQLWYRPLSTNKVCDPTENEYAQIFGWFNSHSLPSPTKQEIEEYGNSQEGELKSDANSGSPVIYKTIRELEKIINLRKDHFVLISGDIPRGLPRAGAISLIPWIAVFDMDSHSRDIGLLRENEQFISSQRSLHVSTWREPAPSIVEEGTRWCFIRGRRDDPNSKINPPDDVRVWYKTVQTSLDAHIEQLRKFASGYTILTVVLIWPADETIAPFLQKMVLKLDESIEPAPKFVLFMSSNPTTSMGQAVYELLCSEYKQTLTIFQLELKDMMSGLTSFLKRSETPKNKKFELPHSDECLNNNITDENAAWLREDVDVLFRTCPYANVEDELNVLQEEKKKFYRGGTLHWSTWYGCDSRSLDVPRDLRDKFTLIIQDHINENRGCLLYLYHDPGSGGTTLSQRLLWDFHTQVPCVHLKTRTYTSIRTLKERIEFLYDKTFLPVILLVDGEDEMKVKSMFRELNARSPIIIICVKRHPFQENDKKVSFQKLKGHVSVGEAKNLALQYIEQCKDDQKKVNELKRLYEEVKSKRLHCLYEFGLTAFLHEFTGLTSYVRGYLQHHINHSAKSMDETVRILGYLSLAYFYGHTSLPCQFFTELLHKPSNYAVDIDDFPYPINLFIVPDDTEGRRKNIRTCHYLIAKEILECILGSDKKTSGRCGNELSYSAKLNLSQFCLELIDYASSKKLRGGVSTDIIVHCLTRIFIFRDNKDVGQTTELRRKPVLSRVMNDIHSNPPNFSERLQVLERLTNNFPNDASFLAHLGRFYSFCRPDETEKAEECFKKALELCPTCKDEEDTIDDRSKTVLVHIYHMYGTVLQRRIGRYTGNAAHDEPEKETNQEDFRHRLDDIRDVAKDACRLFENCRKFTATGQENGYGYTGEINVRLQVCDFVQRNYRNGEGANGIKGFLSSSGKGRCKTKEYIRKSAYIIPNLISECYMVVEKEDIDPGLKKAIIWYNHLFQAKQINVEGLSVHEDNNSYRLKIAIRKQRYAKSDDSLVFLEYVDNPQDITEIIECYEKIIQNMACANQLCYRKRKESELEFMEWLIAIRHRLCLRRYTVTDVLEQVEIWHGKIPSAMSLFYNFVLKSIIGIGTTGQKGDTAALLDAQAMIKKMQQYGRSVLRPKYPREWMGTSTEGIKCLIPGTRHPGLSPEDHSQSGRDARVFKGTIAPPNRRKASGFIQLDLGDNNIEVRVFFIPNTVNLSGSQYASKRVEFELAFSLQHGYEAFAVKLLKLYGCSNCDKSVVICSRESSARCPDCQTLIQRDDFTLIQGRQSP
ncbi:LOW QUALITY PROTEIN: uncharacterized protein [Argopecten irradians]|uniref:LOW QUALITY PROTEIN: uncharacterized protein n=1 Tax=Argopecten irradians TaxID=31199 RepID=UPI003718BA9E